MANMMKVKCPECSEKFELDKNEHDEGDFVNCPECDSDLILKVKNGSFSLKSEKDKYSDYEDELENYYGEEYEE